jgi:hypothetical protein
LNYVTQLIGNIVLIAACMVIPVKGCFFLYQHWFPPVQAQQITNDYLKPLTKINNNQNGIDNTPKSIMFSKTQKQLFNAQQRDHGVVVSTALTLLKHPLVIFVVFLVCLLILLFITRVVVFVKFLAKPFHIMALYGSYILAKHVVEIGITNDYSKYQDFLFEFLKKLF